MTYSLPVHVAEELDRRTAATERSKSTVVAEALELYFAEQDRRFLAEVYAEAAEDPLFQADNESVLHDFAALDAEVDSSEDAG